MLWENKGMQLVAVNATDLLWPDNKVTKGFLHLHQPIRQNEKAFLSAVNIICAASHPLLKTLLFDKTCLLKKES